jgi:peptidoglycan/xylan/chitin deacetylase (PgdA/CDA1 family)
VAWAVAQAGPAVVLLSDGPGAVPVTAAALVVAIAVARWAPRWPGRIAPLLGLGFVLVALVLLAATPQGAITVVIGAVAGAGSGLLAAGREGPPAATAGAAIVAVAAIAAVLGRIAGLQAAGALAVLVALVLLRAGASGRRPLPGASASGRWAPALAATAAAVLALGLVGWVGANDPSVQWFGPVAAHGPRGAGQVALTFDDGPDPRWTLEVAGILDRHGVQGTFFEVGRAVDAHPEVARRLVERGHLLANHSYHHDGWRWLDPRYPELERAQRAIHREVGLCPALFRPPHGRRTPSMLWQVRRRGMQAVTWDVSAPDRSDTDARRVARRIVERARPGSIILLHDGLDGTGGPAGADRSVLVDALPRVLDGLEAKGLEPVRLDRLLGVPGYLDPDDC